MRRRRVNPFRCRLCRSWHDETDVGVTRRALPDGTRFILCGGCSARFDVVSASDREQLLERIRTAISEMEILV